MPKSNRREFLQLAQTYNSEKDDISGFYMSEKLDGGRAFWDGGLSRGVPTEKVPWAGVIDPATGEKKAKIKRATGLWSRYGNPIMAPDWFLNQLPCCPLDGELWAGRGNFQVCMSAIRKDVPVDAEWRRIKYAVYSSPALPSLFQSGEIKNSNMHCQIIESDCCKFWSKRFADHVPDFDCSGLDHVTFDEELAFLNEALETQSDHVFLHRQIKLPNDRVAAEKQMEEYLTSILEKGGEGLIVRDGKSIWTPKRHRGILKFKPYKDDEGVIIGFVAGEEGKTGARLGGIGSLLVRWKGKEFRISGITQKEQVLNGEFETWAKSHPGEEYREKFSGYFISGQKVTFKYRELTDDGIPKEARYFRIREQE